MTDIDASLERCFQAVFPALTHEQILSASVEGLEDWDSLRALTLLEILSEEFGRQIPDEDAETLTSFAAIKAYLGRHAG